METQLILKDISEVTYTFFPLTPDEFATLFKRIRIRDFESNGLPFDLRHVILIGKVEEIPEVELPIVCSCIPPHKRYGINYGLLSSKYTFRMFMKRVNFPEYGCITKLSKKPVKYEDIDK